jgi:hypothetical protein
VSWKRLRCTRCLQKTTALLDFLKEYCQGEGRAKEWGIPARQDEHRVIVFVQERTTAAFISDMIAKDSHLSDLCPLKLTGHGNDSMGMGHKQQQQVIGKFRAGECNILVATSVAEEGLDIGACNMVIRYDTMNTVTALIQSRGRARHKDSHFVVIHTEGSFEQTGLDDLEMQEANMLCVAREITSGDTPDFEERLNKLKLERRFLQSDAISLLKRYCERISSGEKPSYEKHERISGAVSCYRSCVRLPMGCGVSAPIPGSMEGCKTRELADQDAAYQACILLHNSGRFAELDLEGCNFFLSDACGDGISLLGATGPSTGISSNSKGHLQEWLVARKRPMPEYDDPTSTGPSHDPVFTATVTVQTTDGGKQMFDASERNKKKAQAVAAARALEHLREGEEEPAVAGAHSAAPASSPPTVPPSIPDSLAPTPTPLQDIYLQLQAHPDAVDLLDDLGVEGGDDLEYLEEGDVAALAVHLKKVPAAKLHKLLGK